MAHLLLCGRCGGTLPRPEPGSRFVTCPFCEATSDLDTGERQSSAKPARFVSISKRFPAELAAFEQALGERINRGEPALLAFRGAAESALSDVVDPDTLTNVAFGLAADFRQQKDVDVTSDALAMWRIALAYLDSLDGFVSAGEESAEAQCTINLPFLVATAQGPLHFQQDFTMARLRELAATPPVIPEPPKPEPAAAPAPEAVEPPPAKQSWWKKVFG